MKPPIRNLEEWVSEAVRPKEILLVDDDPEIHELLTRYLRYYNCNITSAMTGAQAMEILSKRKTDVAVVDLKMNGMCGAQLFSAIRQQDIHTPIIIFSGNISPEKVAEVSKSGFCLFLIKPTVIDKEFIEHFCHILGIRKAYCQ